MILALIIICTIAVYTWIKAGRMAYSQDYKNIVDLVRDSHVDHYHYNLIDGLLKYLTPHSAKDRENKRKLWVEFEKKFKEISKYKIDDNL